MLPSHLKDVDSIELAVKMLTKKHGTEISTRYLHDIEGFAEDVLGIVLWDSEVGNSQAEIVRDVQLSFSQQVERRDYELGILTEEELEFWTVGEDIKTVFNAQSGHGIGKTLAAAIIALWLFVHFSQSITYTFSPTKAQAVGLLWKEINKLHKTGNISGKALELRIKDLEYTDHFIEGRTVPRSAAGATESVHGQHSPFFLAICDEAQAYNQSLFDGIESILGSGISVLVLLSNPKYAHVAAQKYRTKKRCKSYTISVLNYPNVVHNMQIIPGGTNRDYVYRMLEDCEIVDVHKPELETFQLPWEGEDSPIYVPSNNFLWRVLGKPSTVNTGNIFFSSSMIEDAINEEIILADPPNVARIGVDFARFGSDSGVIYYRYKGAVHYYSTLTKSDGNAYVEVLDGLLNYLLSVGVSDVQLRLDSTGGYASTVEDTLNKNQRWGLAFDYFEIIPVSYGANAFNAMDYSNTVTELYGETGKQVSKGLRLRGFVPETLVQELTGRTFSYKKMSNNVLKAMNLRPDRYNQLLGTEVKDISKKQEFRNLNGFSPDNSDGLTLAACPDWVFLNHIERRRVVNSVVQVQKQKQRNNRRMIAWPH